MFDKKYKEQMKKISPDESKVRAMKVELNDIYAQNSKPSAKFTFKKASALACFCLAFVLVFTMIKVANSDKPFDHTYAGIYQLLREKTNLGNYYFPGTAEIDLSSSDSGTTAQKLEDYSDTNLQVAGVQEADIIKTDGKYIYALSNYYLYIIETDNGQMTVLSKFDRATNSETEEDAMSVYTQDIFVVNNRLIVLKSSYHYTKNIDGEIGICLYWWGNGSTVAEIYDITDKADIGLVGVFEQDGYYSNSRMIGNVLYLVSNYNIYSQIDQNNPETFVPKIICNGETQLVEPEDICVNENLDSASYVVISAYDTVNGEFLSNKSLLGYGGEIYMNTDNLYVISSIHEIEKEGNVYTSCNNSLITKFSLNNGYIEEKASAKVEGTVLNQFSMDEYNGYFRIVTTINSWTYTVNDDGSSTSTGSGSETYNNLYILNENLTVVGQLQNLAQGERVYSARFDGNTGYIVTFRQVDPLFSIDLSNPANPIIMGELKIPGFSNYLHNYGDNLLFGLGRDADEQTGGAGYIKLSMFNTSDKTNVTEEHSLIIDGMYYSEASYNHKAILINYERNIIAFPADNVYLVYSYDAEQGFVQLAALDLTNGGYDWYWGSMRGLYIGNVLYVFSNNVMISYDMQNFKEIYSMQIEEADPSK